MFLLLVGVAGAEQRARARRLPAPVRRLSPENDSNILGPTPTSTASSEEKTYMWDELRRSLRSPEETAVRPPHKKTTRVLSGWF